MKPTVNLNRAGQIIQGWFRQYCKDYGKPEVVLDIVEEHDKVSRAYKVTNPANGHSAPIFWSEVSDYETSGSIDIPGDMKAGIWDNFSDLF
jgi:hypothetical protein